MKATIISLFIACLCINNAPAQSANKTLNDISQTVEKVGDIFKKKKREGASANDTSGTKPGSMSPNIKILNVDEMGPFNGGAAVVKKGSAYALIDAQGNLVTPFSNYMLINTSAVYDGGMMAQNVIMNGFFLQDSLGHKRVLNAKGKVIAGANITYLQITADGKYAVFKDGNKYLFIDTLGRKTVLQSSYLNSNESSYLFLKTYFDGIGAVQLSGNAVIPPAGYINLRGEWMMPDKYEFTEAFSEGLACVGKQNQYGEMQYGFIDARGNVAVPFSYSNQPGNFNSGRARVEPKDPSAFACAFINRKGDIVIKCQIPFSNFSNGYAYDGGGRMMDTTGKIFGETAFFQKRGVRTPGMRDEIWVHESDKNGRIHDGKIRFQRTSQGNAAEDYNTMGYFDLATQKIIAPAFQYVHDSKGTLWFDAVSKLAYAERYLGNKKIRKGYINEDGVFVIVMAEKSEW